MTQFQTITAEPARDRWGRPLVPGPNCGKPIAYTRCTTFVDVLEDKYNLQKWMQRMVAVGLSTRQDLHLGAAALASDPDGNKSKLDALCEQAIEAAKGTAKATIGTALHAFVERINLGHDPGPVPPEFQLHITNYQSMVQAAGITPIHVERFTVHDELRVGGTPDLIAELQGHEGRFVVDLKTGPNTLRYGSLKVAMQLAVYAHSQLIDLDTGQRTVLDGIRHDKALVIALDSETAQCDLHWIDIAAGWEAVQIAAQVRKWRSRKDLLSDFNLADFKPAPSLVNEAAEAALLNAIAAATDRDALTDLWTQSSSIWTDVHTQAAQERLASLEVA